MYLMEDALTGLHSQKTNLAYLVLGSKTGVRYYMGISMPANYEGGPGEAEHISFSTLKSILYSVYNGVDIYKDAFSADSIKAMVSPLANHIGLMTGIPALKSTAGDTLDSEQIERLANGLQGHDFGMLTLAVPIPPSLVNQEEFNVVDQIQKAQENEDPEKKRRIKYYLELQDAYLKQYTARNGYW